MMTLEQFINHYQLNAAQIMWFLGAGSSRSANMPSATDIIWDLKRRHYCIQENQSITDNELSNESVRHKIQSYFDSLDAPTEWSENEYSYYFNLVFGEDLAQQQKYLEEKLSPALISLNTGQRVLAALMAMSKAKVVFTTNFDSVIENAYAFLTSMDIQAFNLNGSYAALNALNNEQFPIYAKMHGDFRYYEMKNLPEQLQKNDAEIEKCFINACSRYGLVVVGYSGRDQNVMNAFDKAIENENAFPKGLFWINSVQGYVFPGVTSLIEKAKAKGIAAEIIDGDTFDGLMGSIWKQLPSKPEEFDTKIRRSIFQIPQINRPITNTQYPLIRMNSFSVKEMPVKCLSIETNIDLSSLEFKERLIQAKSSAIVQKESSILAWGPMNEIHKIIKPEEIIKSEEFDLKDALKNFKQNSLLNAFYTRAVVRALLKDKPLVIKKRHGSFYAVISSKHEKFSEIETVLKSALKKWDYNSKKMVEPRSLAGFVNGVPATYWMECVEISLEHIDNNFWIVLVPDIWIEPGQKRREVRDFLTNMKRSRFNKTQNDLLQAWKKILFGDGSETDLSAFDESVENNPTFKIQTTSAYSFRTKK